MDVMKTTQLLGLICPQFNMRWHPRRLLVFVVCCTIFVGIITVYRRTNSFNKKRRIVSRGKRIQRVHAEDDDIFWGDLNRFGDDVDANHEDKWTNNQVIDGLSNILKMNIGNGDSHSGSDGIKFNLNVELSDELPLNRKVPDSRPKGCDKLTYPSHLPTTSVVIPFHNEWPSVLMRTVHSLINRTSPHILKQIILVDDASTLDALKAGSLDKYVNGTFPGGVVKIVRLTDRQGLIRARLEGFKHVTSEVVSFFDSHMEVNKDWVQPLLNEIVQDPRTVAMAQLDYIDKETFQYTFYENYRTRYGFKWDMEFFETFFRPDQLKGKLETDPLPGVLMVGPGFAVKSQYFRDLGMYDGGMKIWGGENIEFAWRTWMCGGRLLHVPCSRVGHIERSQPYSFPQGRKRTELRNYKRASEVWMGPYKKYVHDALPGIKNSKEGILDDRIKLKNSLDCKDFSWFLKNIWPELLPYEDVGPFWGQVKEAHGGLCLDNSDYLFRDPNALEVVECIPKMARQGFALTSSGQLRTTLHCVVVLTEGQDLIPVIQNCMLDTSHKWKYDEKHHHLIHRTSSTCLQILSENKLVLLPCDNDLKTQQWLFVKKPFQD